jgi:hypothetical protein
MAVLIGQAVPLFAAGLPNSVQFKVDMCNKSLNEADEELNNRNPHMAREPLRVAKDRLNSIKEYQADNWNHADVVAARNRYEVVEKKYNEASKKESGSAGTAKEQLKRLESFRQFNSGGTYPEHMIASQAQYLQAKALIDEIAAAGTDVQLKGYSDYSMTKLKVGGWEESRKKVVQAFIDTAKKYTQKNVSRGQDWLDLVDQRLVDIGKLLSADSPKIAEARTTAEAMRVAIRQEQQEKAAKVFMSPENYKGKDADSLRALAKKAVLNKFPKAAILKIKLVSSKWGAPEGGLQWTDNTMSSVESRTTSYFSVEIATKQGQDVFLHRVYLYKSRVNGQLQSAKSYVVGTQMMLEKNVK